MEKFDLSNCSIVIPVSIDSKERLEHIQFLYKYFDQHFLNHELIVVEQGDIPKVPKQKNVRMEFVEKGGSFSSAAISNIGASLVSNPFFCKYDVDAFIHPKAIFDAFEMLKTKSEKSFILPYNGISLNIKNPLRYQLMQLPNFQSLPFIEKDELDGWAGENMDVKNDNSKGLIHLFRTKVFKEFGGYNEEFFGWGYEDDEILARFEKLTKPATFLDSYNAFHFDHPRTPGDPLQAFKNQYRSLVVKNMDIQDISEYIKTWSRFF